VRLQICYHECEAEPAAVLVPDACEPEQRCENGMIRERYRLHMQTGLPDAVPGIVTHDQCGAIFAEPPPRTTRRQVVCETLAGPCVPPRADCVTLATIQLTPAGIKTIDRCTYRSTVYSNAVLLDLILCLAERVDRCCGALEVKVLQMISGNNQTATVNQRVPQPLVVRVVEAGNPVANEDVTFDVVSGGGVIGSNAAPLAQTFKVKTVGTGLARLPIWQLGNAVGDQHVSARIAAGAPGMVTFRAVAERAVIDLPVVRAIWPTNAVSLNRASADPIVPQWFKQWMSVPRLELTFNHKMNPYALEKPSPWLRVFHIGAPYHGGVQVAPLAIRYAGPAQVPVLPEHGFTEVFGILGLQAGVTPSGRYLVLIRAEAGNILDTSAPPLLLDAEFGGTKLPPQTLDDIWKLAQPHAAGQAVWDALVDTGARLPQSGNDVEGGLFHSWFEVTLG
jgi:hypothetical protein